MTLLLALIAASSLASLASFALSKLLSFALRKTTLGRRSRPQQAQKLSQTI